MSRSKYGKNVRRKLADLVGKAYERELGQHLDELYEKFNAWKKGELVSSELSTFIHKYYNGASREVYSIYNNLDMDDLVARAVAMQLLTQDELPENIFEKIESKINYFCSHQLADE